MLSKLIHNIIPFFNRMTCVVLCLCLLLVSSAFSQGVKDYEFAGSFYPKNKDKLSSMINGFISDAKVILPEGDILGIVCPHAGYIYSGPVAGYSYRAIRNYKVKTIIILAPSHHYYFKGISIYPDGFFNTPFGKLRVDSNLALRFGQLSFVSFESKFFYGEHSIEVELPFIKKIMPDVSIIPVLFGDVNLSQMKTLAKFIAELYKNNRILVIVSTDMSHYHSYFEARTIDLETVSHVRKKDYSWLWDSVKKNEMHACGILPLITFILYTDDLGGSIKILKYANSGDTQGYKKKVVGYMSAIAYRIRNLSKKEDKMGFTDDDKRALLNIARRTLEAYLGQKKVPEFETASDSLKEKRMVFVTLKEKGQLRGCIGRIVPDTPLYKAVSEVAIDSAIHDPRFPAVRFDELGDIEIEISVMTPFEKVNNLDEIKVGRDGLLIKKGFHSGLLLPQVPGEFGWDKKTYLENLCRKAGLYNDAYKEEDAVIYRFSADVFSEKELLK